MSRAGHVLQDNRRFAGQVLAQMMGNDLRRDLETTALGADENGYRFALEKIGLPPDGRAAGDQPGQTDKNFYRSMMHNASFRVHEFCGAAHDLRARMI